MSKRLALVIAWLLAAVGFVEAWQWTSSPAMHEVAMTIAAIF